LCRGHANLLCIVPIFHKQYCTRNDRYKLPHPELTTRFFIKAFFVKNYVHYKLDVEQTVVYIISGK